MLLSTSRPNQLRQQEIAQISSAFNEWAKYCQLKRADGNAQSSPFVVDLQQDEGALYYHWHKDSINLESSSLRFIELGKLVEILRERIQNLNSTEGLPLSIKILSPTVLRHLLQSWSASSQRAFSRSKTSGTVSLAFGLGAIHHYLSGGMDFGSMLLGGKEELILEGDENPFLSNKSNRNYGFSEELRSGGDVWSIQAVASSAKESGTKVNRQEKLANQFRHFDCNIIDTSPGGYCIEWNGVAPSALKTGEIIAIKEDNQENWSIGAVRWIKKLNANSMRMGLELLAPHAEALGAKVVRKDGATTEYMRAIRLPELKAIGQPSSLITPQLTFKAGYKVLLNVHGEEIKLQLTKEIGATASFSQFEYKIIGEKLNKLTEEKQDIDQDDEFNSLWTSL